MLLCGQAARIPRLRKSFRSQLLVIFDETNPEAPHRADAHEGGEATGAMSWAFIKALKKNPQQSYVQLLNSIRVELAGKYDQKPQLSCSHPLGKHYLPGALEALNKSE